MATKTKSTPDQLECFYCGAIKKEIIFAIGASKEPDWCMVEGTGKITCPACYPKATAHAENLFANIFPQKMAEGLKSANQAALKHANHDDGGSCNFDSAVIYLKGVKQSAIEKVQELSGIRLTPFSSPAFPRGSYWIGTATHGQGNRRTKMAEAAYNYLKDAGFLVGMYYQMD